MIAFIKGKVSSYGVDWVVLENEGIGWYINYPHSDTLKLNDNVIIYTYMNVTENDVSLFGFESLEEKELFLKLISVKGLGPKTALNMLSRSNYNNLIATIEQGNVDTLKAIPGIGAKTASQIILDLKGKLVATTNNSKKYSSEINDACEALKNLGYKQGEIASAANIMSERPNLSTEEYVKIGLQHLMKKMMG